MLAAQLDRLKADADGYRALATNLAEHGVLGHDQQPSAYRPPLYPLMLTACVAGPWQMETAVAVVHLLLGVTTVWLTLWLGHRWKLGGCAYLAAAMVACDPILLNQSTLVMTETLATLLAVASLALTTIAAESNRRRQIVMAAFAGASFGAAALCRPTFLLSLVFTLAAFAWLCRLSLRESTFFRGAKGDITGAESTFTVLSWRQMLKSIMAMCIAAACVLFPWAARNTVRFGKPIITTTHGGYTVLLGNNLDYYEFLKTAPWRAVWHADELDAVLTKRRSADEVANDRHEYALAWQAIRNQPGMFLYASLSRVGALWNVLPHQTRDDESSTARLTRYAIAAWYVAVFSLALVSIFFGETQLTRSPWLFAIALAASFTAAHFIYWTDMRMRAPLMPAISLFAAEALKFLAQRWMKTARPKT